MHNIKKPRTSRGFLIIPYMQKKFDDALCNFSKFKSYA